jgi:glycosyltransferase involved in cell wall biosynthesis
VILEAMAVGCPIIATAVGAIPQVLSEESAWIIPVDDEVALTRALREALGETPAATNRAAVAKSVFLSCYERDVMGRRYLDLYERARRARTGASVR